MSSSGINPLAIVAPDLYAKQLAIQRRQALAQSLMGDQNNSPTTQYSGLANAGNRILGAFLAKGADQDMANLYAGSPQQAQQAPQQPAPQAPTDSGQISNAPSNAPPQPSSLNPSQIQPQPQPQPQQQAPIQRQGGIAGAMSSAVPDLPGMTHQQSMLMYVQQPNAYFTALAAANAPTPDQKNANAAFGSNTPSAQQALQGVVTKAGSVEVRPEGFIRGPDGRITYGPNESSNVYYTTGPNNEPIAHMIQGGAEAAAGTAGAIESAKEGAKIFPDVQTSTGAKIPMTGAQAIGGMSQSPALPLGIRSNNPGNLQPGGQEAAFATPAAGISAMSKNIDSYSSKGLNTVGQIVSRWAPPIDGNGRPINDTAAYIADVSARMGIRPNQPLNLDDPTTKAMLMHSMIQHENGMQPYQGQQPANPQATPQIGESTAQAEVNKNVGESAAAAAKAQSVTQSTLQAIDGLIALNDKVPDSTGMSPEWKADINKRIPGVFKGDAGALAQWNQLNGIGVLGGLKQLQGLGRLDLPEVKQVITTNGVPSDVPRDQRLAILNNLKTMLANNLAASKNNVTNLNQGGITTPTQTAPMQGYGAQPQDIVNELRRRGMKIQ